jgi:hypothetical protein
MINHFGSAVILASACLVSIDVAVPTANAAGKFDGTWSAILHTTSGPCPETARGTVQVANGIVRIEGMSEQAVSGRVSPTGSVTVTISTGGNYGVGTGRLRGQSGGGRWRAQFQNSPCSGTWSGTKLN